MTIELLFLDGEEAIGDWTGQRPHLRQPALRRYRAKAGTLKDIRAFILVDMIGDRDLRIKREAARRRG